MKRQLILLVVAAVVCAAAVPLVGNLDPALAAEGGLLENLQVGLLLLGAFAFLLNARRAERGFTGFFMAAALLCINGLLREVDVEDLTTVRWIVFAGSGVGRNVILFGLWAALVFRYRSSFVPLLRNWRGVAGPARGITIVGGGLALLLGDAFEQGIHSGANAQVFEEFFETAGYFLVVLAAWSAARTFKKGAGSEST